MDLRYNHKKLEEYRRRAAALVAQMTLEEKVSQTLYNSPAIARLGVFSYNWWNEALHGVARAGTATVFPQAIALAAMFDEQAMEQVADAISTEARAKYNAQQAAGDHDIYKGLTFWTPNVNIFRDPRWGRGHETYGEDPYLTGRLGVRFIEGLQGHDPDYLKTAACAKHYAVHSGPEAVRHQFDAHVTKQDLYATYLPAFQACVQEGGVEIVMGAYNRINGEPCCASRHLLEDILRKAWGFTGHITSDFGALRDFHEGHNITKNAEDSAALAMNCGCDLNAGTVYEHLLEAVRNGKVKESRIDEALTNLFATRMKLGMFDPKGANPYDAIPYSVVDSEPMRSLNEKIAERCPVLLKNNGLLPLHQESLHTIGVIGPNADSRRALVGNYEGTASRYITVLEGIQDLAGEDVRVLYSQGCHLYKDRVSALAQPHDRDSEVQRVCAESDVIVAVMGLDADLEGEEGDVGNEFASGDKRNLDLPGLQQETLRLIAESGKPAVLILLTGSAMALEWESKHFAAILQGWYPGAQGGRAIARLLFGEANPEGRLPITFYRTTEELPDFADYSMKERTYRYMSCPALYPFGFGLSYTSFSYRGETLSAQKIDRENGLDVTATVENLGAMAGTETVQVYVRAPGGEVPNAQLKGIAKVELLPGESKTVTIHLPAKAFETIEADGSAKLRRGCYQISVGGSQPEPRSEALTGHVVTILTAEY
jgi:beta-glucosidase